MVFWAFIQSKPFKVKGGSLPAFFCSERVGHSFQDAGLCLHIRKLEKSWGIRGTFYTPVKVGWLHLLQYDSFEYIEFDDFSKFPAKPTPNINLSRSLISRINWNVWACRDLTHLLYCRSAASDNVSEVCVQENHYQYYLSQQKTMLDWHWWLHKQHCAALLCAWYFALSRYYSESRPSLLRLTKQWNIYR